MYVANLTGSFTGVYPSTIPVSRRNVSSAISFYKKALSATESSRSKGTLTSNYGFTFKITAASHSGASVRLQLPAGTDHVRVARKLANGGTVFRDRRGIVVTDPYSVTWTVA